MKKIAFYTLGCKLNYAETSTLSRKCKEKGYQHVEFTDHPDIFIINTCSVTENADKKCHKLVRQARSVSPDAYVAIVGCYAQLKPKEIANIPGVDAVLGAHEKFRLPELLDRFVRTPQPTIQVSSMEQEVPYHASYSLQDRTRAFLKVQDGCDYTCSFCTIPLARGQSRSEYITNVVRNAENLAEKGVREIVLTGVNIGDFGLHQGKRKERFIDLIKALDEVEGINRFRISSIEPNLLTEEIIDRVAQSRRFAPHFHIPLQSGSNTILRLMRRRYQRALYQSKVEKIKSLIPHCCIGVDVITGFPQETDKEFMETHAFLQDLDVSYLHVFPYSKRDNTPAAYMNGFVPAEKKHKQSTMLRMLSEKKKRSFYESQIGVQAQVLFEKDVKNGHIHGFTEHYIRVAVPHSPLLINALKTVRLRAVNEKGIMEAVPEPHKG